MESWSSWNVSGVQSYIDSMVASANILIGVNILLMVLIIISNGMFLITLIRKASLHTVSNILLGALSLSDLLIGTILEPFGIFQLVKLSQLQYNAQLLAIKVLLSHSLIGLSFVYVTLITCDRYLAICHPFKYLRYATNKLALTAPGFAFLLISMASITLHFISNAKVVKSLYIIDTIAFVIGLLLIVTCNCRIFTVIMKQKSQVTAMANLASTGNENLINREREKRRTNVVVVLLVVFLICYLPPTIVFHFLMRTYPWKLDSRLVTVIMWMDFLLCLNSLANPLLYCFRLQSIRRAMIETFSHMKRPFLGHGS